MATARLPVGHPADGADNGKVGVGRNRPFTAARHNVSVADLPAVLCAYANVSLRSSVRNASQPTCPAQAKLFGQDPWITGPSVDFFSRKMG
jgi:hypothetical protein